VVKILIFLDLAKTISFLDGHYLFPGSPNGTRPLSPARKTESLRDEILKETEIILERYKKIPDKMAEEHLRA